MYSFATLRDHVILAGTNRGIFISQNNGLNWSPRSEAYIDGQVQALMVTQSETLFAAANNGLYRSVDTGLTWIALDSGLESPSFTSLAQGGDSLFAGSNQGVIWSKDNGETWTQINEGLIDLQITTLEYTQEGDVLAGTEEGVFQLVQLSDNWQRASEGLNKSTDRNVNIIKRFDARRLLAGTASGIFISDADSIAWNPLIGLLDGDREADIIDLAINQDQVIYAATPHSVFRSEDEGINWTPMERKLPPIATSFQSLHKLHLGANEEVLVGTAFYGVYRFIASIQQWEISTQGLSTLSVSSLLINDSGDLLAGANTGLFVSTDQGANWNHTYVLENLEGFDLVHQDRQGRIFANGPSLLVSTDQGASWNAIRADRAQAVIVLEDTSILAHTGPTSVVLKSNNEGETWIEAGVIPSQGAEFVIYQFAEDLSGGVLAGTSEGVFRSLDQGATWNSISPGNTPDIGRSLSTEPPGYIFIGGDKGLYRSDRDGQNMELILEVESGVQKVLTIGEQKIMVFTSNEGIFHTIDGAQTWNALNDGLPEEAELLTAVVDYITLRDAASVYVSVKNTGVYQGRAVISLSSETPDLVQNLKVSAFPNPFSNRVHLAFDIEHPGQVRIEVFDVLGRYLQTVYNAFINPGSIQLTWNTSKLPRGAYFIRIHTDTATSVRTLYKVR